MVIPQVSSSVLIHQKQTTAAISRMQQCFVGSIASFENHFGALWGHGLSEDELSPQQQEFRAIWAECRKEIFDKGNAQIKAIKKDFSAGK